jgi:hypothetical protein
MIDDVSQLNQAVEQLGRMYRALAALKQDILPRNERQFGLFAEGPLDEIRKLEEAIDDYTGKAALDALGADLWLRIVGPSLVWPETPSSIITGHLDALRKGVLAIAEFLSSNWAPSVSKKELRNACDLRVVAIRSGSIAIGIRAPDESHLDDSRPAALEIASKALAEFVDVAHWVAEEQPQDNLKSLFPTEEGRRIALNAVKPLAPRARGDVESIVLSGRIVGAGNITISKAAYKRIEQAIESLGDHQLTTS